jgi:hypothetical protein
VAKLSPENVARLKQLIADGVEVLQECEDLKSGLNDTVKSIAEELDVKPAILNKLIRTIHKGSMNDQREDFDELEELYKAGGLG